jgi:uncharacterized protein YprB with RNaseH-like and TPR domain
MPEMSAAELLNRSGALWQQRIESLREYEIIRDGNVFGANFFQSPVLSSAYEDAMNYLGFLLEHYNGVPFESVFQGTEEVNDGGICFEQESRHDVVFCPVDTRRFWEEILLDLTLVHRIGPAIQKKLKAKGYTTLTDLATHPRYRSSAKDVLACLSAGNSGEIMNLIGGRHSRSHQSILGTAGLHEPEDFVFFDIETLGLFSRPIILLGIGTLDRGKLIVRQYLVRDIGEEPAALIATLQHISGGHPALVTFNGKAFDLPYLAERLSYYGMSDRVAVPHFDMLHFSRMRWKHTFASLRLTTLEKEILGIRRNNDVPGQMVPEFYESYLRSGNCGPLVPIVEHNRQDIVSLARLFFHLVRESYGCI